MIEGILGFVIVGGIIGGVIGFIRWMIERPTKRQRSTYGVNRDVHNEGTSKRWIGVLTGFVTLIMVVGFSTWYNDYHYPASYDNAFLSSCEGATTSATSCGCALNVVKADYNYDEAKQIDASGKIPDRLRADIRSSCR